MLIDARNWDEQASLLNEHIAKADFIGLDCETHDDNRHEGLNQLCGYDAKTRKKSKTKKLVFDMRRTELCGVSLYTESMSEPVYINVGHADVENRVTHDQFRALLPVKRQGAYWVAHNAPFETTVFRSTLGHDLVKDGIICTMQMCVSAYGPQQYDHTKWVTCGVGAIETLIPQLVDLSLTEFDPETGKMSNKLEEFIGKITSKESDAAHSYNGLINAISYGYGLKQAVKSHFGVHMTTFEECLGGKAHMGQLTGAETAAYGGDDAFWALRLFRHLLTMMDAETLKCFFEQENPMIGTYADIWAGGMRVDFDAIERRVVVEREEAAKILQRLRAAVRALLPFPVAPNEALGKRDEWYQKNHAKYRTNITKWAELDDASTPFEELSRAAGSVSHNWMKEEGKVKSMGPNFSHYMPIRTLMYDLIGAKPIIYQGKTQSDGETRGQLRDKLTDKNAIEIIDCINALSGVDQRMKLFIAPYRLLTDPETNRLYPVVTSMLATRRMAARDPNPMQLAKRGESTYVRGFFLPDEEDHVMVSIDWSAIELVEIGEFSGDPKFIEAFSQIPHQDLHSGAAASILEVECPGLTVEAFKGLRQVKVWDEFANQYGLNDVNRLATNLKGEALSIDKAYKYWRTEVGKGANFNYWYSGFLTTIGERLGWGSETTQAATEKYANHFAAAEQWRRDTIARIKQDGFIRLPDGHCYTKYEATEQWFLEWLAKFGADTPNDQLRNYHSIIRKIGQRIARRAGNQTVNAFIQGTCATIAKRSIRRVDTKIKQDGFQARFMIPVHDELIWSVHRKEVADFIPMARGVMIDHPDIFQKCKLDASPSVGLTFEPWNENKAPTGQVELFELPKQIVGEEWADKRADSNKTREVIDWLFEQRKKAA
jgi:DNA polymerase I-like protein with 3'-5' exonuclease and polymerase domains